VQYWFGGLGNTPTCSERTRTEYGSFCTMPPPGNPTVDNRRNVVSASYLTHMISPTRDTIYFRYTPDTITYRNPIDYTLHRLQLTGGDCEPINNFNQCYTTSVHTGYKISQITSANGVSVRFMYASAKRLDAPTSRRLEAVEVTDGTTRKRFTLSHSYFASALAGAQPDDDPLGKALHYRLRLDAVQEEGVPSYQLVYHQGPGLANVFPVRGSFSQDAMGYFNNRGNSSLVDAAMLDDAGSSLEPVPTRLVNRRIDTAAVKLGMLERITYPTGGTSRLTYEANEYFANRRYFQDSLVYLAQLQVSANDDAFPGRSNQVQKTFTLTQPTDVHIHFWTSATYATATTTAAGAYIINQVTNQGVYAMAPGPNDERTLSLSAGTYTLVAYAQDMEGNPVLTRADIWVKIRQDRYIGNYPFYGCRIKSITSSGKTAFGEDVATLYSYRQLAAPAAPAASSGYVLYQPKLKYVLERVTARRQLLGANTQTIILSDCTYDVLSQSPLNPVGSIHGGNIAYSAVTVTERSQQADVQTQYVYSNVSDKHLVTSYPFPPPSSYDWQRGLLLKKISLVNTGTGQYRPVQVTRNTYTALHNPYILEQVSGELDFDGGVPPIPIHAHETIIPAYRVQMVKAEIPIEDRALVNNYKGIFNGLPYFYISAFQYPAREETTNYGPAGDSVTTRKWYVYASPRHTQPTAIKTLTSTGDTLINYLTYPADYALAPTPSDPRAGALRKLQELHIKSAVVERTTYRVKRMAPPVLLQGQLTEYGVVKLQL